MKVYLDTVGCRLNHSEIETFANQFRQAGHTLVAQPGEADLVVVNTCTVTAAAASDSRQKIRQAAHAGAGDIVVTGCWATLEPGQAALLPGVRGVFSNLEKDRLVPSVLGLPEEAFDLEPLRREPLPGLRQRTRAFIKAQDGCNNRCTFCITTLARGSSRSRTIPQVLADIRAALQGGAREIVLTGVHLGSWGKDLPQNQRLFHLAGTILDQTDVSRLRFSSLEPWDLDEAFFSLWDEPRMCRHLHLPLQSGSGLILRRMARRVTPDSFAGLVEQARSAVPDMAITTDIIVGFPGEGESEFEESLDYVRQMKFAGGHVFTYSPRNGTAAAGFADQVPSSVKKMRSTRMRAILADASRIYRQRFVGSRLDVLWETADGLTPQGWRINGLTDNYLRVTSIAPTPLWNEITPVQLLDISSRGLRGQILE
ncbi:MAG: MiaB/RimO family radical SAM methylthiotransferase [Chloroflexi bacterium]|nr:MiaB/RimO family radical SAM methylthiotransferase [Chloroflexota bacterium]